ncbi:hypothetical protein DFR70_104468 [Nocardia tenerifensis]|uniref:Uncharacterized protein n=1 Tax=Nocardia tenerifensis TaxID=228006 RepID=A0A318K1L8_9NOCA|nr:hypothetical protein [Nocardia tenerifensis]PXX65404.1 hypothetical protein DFR70_104468 [Nocardia tenerifensis]
MIPGYHPTAGGEPTSGQVRFGGPLAGPNSRPWLRLAEGGEVEQERRDYDDGPLSVQKPGIIGRFLNWPTIARDLGAGAGKALFAAATGGMGEAATAFTALTSMAGEAASVVQAFGGQATAALGGAQRDLVQSMLKNAPLPVLPTPQIRTLAEQFPGGVQVDRTISVNVIKPEGNFSAHARTPRLSNAAATYMAHLP